MLLDRLRTVAFREKRTDSPRESINPRAESRTTRTLWLPWADRQQSVAELLGYTVVETEAATGFKYLSRRTPQGHPDWPHFPMYATEASELIGEIPQSRSAGDVGAFDEARTTLQYTSRRYNVLTDDELKAARPGDTWARREGSFLRYFEVTERECQSYVTIPPNQGLLWSDGRPFALKAFAITHHTLITLKWIEVPLEAYREFKDPLIPAMPEGFGDLVGCSNQFDMGDPNSVLGLKKAGTMLQGSACKSGEPYRMPNGAWAVDVTVTYRYDPHGNNSFFRPDKPGGPGYDAVSRPPAGTGPPLYPLKDLTLPYWVY